MALCFKQDNTINKGHLGIYVFSKSIPVFLRIKSKNTIPVIIASRFIS